MGNTEHKSDGVLIPIKWGDVSKLPTIYSNQLIVQHTGSECYLVFGEISSIAHGEEKQLPENLEVQPRVKIAITHKNMIAFAKVIHQNTQNLLNRVIPDQDETKGG